MAQSSFKNLAEFFGSTAIALKAQGQRVRNLIGENHWQSDGTYKERLLKHAIREIVPSTFKVGDGFLIYRKDKDRDDYEVSRQIDVLVYDDRFVAPIFGDGDFAIILAETALAAIEVKSSWGGNCSELGDGIGKLQSSHHLYRKAKGGYNPDLFTACIAYTSVPHINPHESISQPIFNKLARQLKTKFIEGLSEYWKIGPKITSDDLRRIDHYKLTTSLCPQMVLSLDTDWILVPGETNSTDLNRWNYNCPVVRQVWTTGQNEKGEPINLSLHLFLGTLRHRCIEWLNHNRRVPELESIRSHLSAFIFNDQYPPTGDPVALIPAIEGAREIFPKVQFLD